MSPSVTIIPLFVAGHAPAENILKGRGWWKGENLVSPSSDSVGRRSFYTPAPVADRTGCSHSIRRRPLWPLSMSGEFIILRHNTLPPWRAQSRDLTIRLCPIYVIMLLHGKKGINSNGGVLRLCHANGWRRHRSIRNDSVNNLNGTAFKKGCDLMFNS